MYPDFSKKNDFFNKSKVIADIKNELHSDFNKRVQELDYSLVNTSVKLWIESIIKHNLDINMMRVDCLHLLSEQNSEEVLDMFGTIMFKSKDERTQDDFQILRNQQVVDNAIKLIVLQNERDYYSELKQEYFNYINENNLSEKSKNKIK